MSRFYAPAIEFHIFVSRHAKFSGGTLAENNFVSRIVDNQKTRVEGARVRVHEAATGELVWAGRAWEQGIYVPHCLTPGVEYVMMALDPENEHEAIAAGPVVAVAEDV